MRVSVVATGIDASTAKQETPMPRRSMAAPLRTTVSAEERNAEVPAAAPAPAPAPIAASQPAPEPEPAPAPAQEPLIMDTPVSEPNLFGEAEQAPLQAADDLPPPAYQPEVPAFEPRPDTMGFAEPAAEELRYEQPARTVRPASPEAHRPADVRGRTGHGEAIGLGPAALGGDRPAPKPEEKRGFGLNSLISRMTGNASDQPAKAAAPRPAAPAAPAAPSAPARRPVENFDADPEANEDKIEIPAFLRRQAN